MGIFDKLFKKHKGDDKYILFAKAGLLLSHADGDFSNQENQWIVEYVESIPNITEDRVDNILKKGSENLAEISSFSELKSLNDKKEFINFLIGVAKADGVLDALELKFITILIEHLSLQDEYEDFLNSIDKKNIEENYDYSNALQVFYKKMENPAIKPWYEIIEKRAGTETIPDFKNDYVLDYTIHLEADMFFHLEKYISRIKLDISDKWRLGVSDLEQRIDVFTEITDALSLLITKAKDLKIDINKEFINNYHAAISSRMGSELGLKVINQKIKVSSEAETVFNRINKKYLAISKTEKIDFITFITDYLKTYFLEYYTKKVDEFVEDKEKNEQGVNTDNLTKNVIRDEDGFKNIYLRHKESSDSDRILLYELLRTEIERTLETLTPREADVVRLFFGLGNQHPMTLEEIGETLELTTERTRQIKEKAIRRIKHTTKSKVLKTYLEYGDQIWNREVRSTKTAVKHIKFNNETLRAAVKEWLSDVKSAEVKYGHISNWDTSEVTDMNKLFLDAHTFNEPLNNWDVSKVTNMHAMFDNAYVFNQPLNNWDVSKVTDMSEMFSSMESLAFNQPIGDWDVSKVTSMRGMFSSATSFNQPIGNWDVSKVTNMHQMFTGACFFNQDISSWDVSNVTSMKAMFWEATSFNQPIRNWDVSKVTNMEEMFSGAEAFNQPIGNWDVSNVTNMRSMFYRATSFNQPIGNWDVRNVTDMSFMFFNVNAFNQDIGSWDVSKVTSMRGMFQGSSFNQDINSWDVSSVTDMSYMFFIATAFNQPLNTWNVSKVTDMSSMFRGAEAFNQPIGNWDVSKVSNMEEMFKGSTFFNQELSSWDVSKVSNMNGMFNSATAFNRSIANWDVSNVLKMEGMFCGANIFYRAIFMEATGPFQVFSTKLNKKKWELLKKYEKLNHKNEEVSLEIENQKYASGWNLNELRVFTQINKTFFLILSDQKIENSKNLKNESKDNRFMHIYSFAEIAIKKESNVVWKEIAKDFPSFFSIYIEEEELYPDSKETLAILENLSKRKKIELLYTLGIVMGLTITLINDSGKNADEIKLKTEKAKSIFNSYYEILKVKFTGEDYKEMQKKYAGQVVDWLNKNSSLNQYFEQPINVFIKANNI